MTNNFDLLSILAVLTVAAASGLVGVFALSRRMTLAADAISHIALPGLGLALLIKVDPIIGGAAALLLGAVLIWALERQSGIPTETVIGVVFSASLAVGSLLIKSDEELLEALFGDLGSLKFSESIVGIILAALIILFILSYRDKFTLSFLSPDLAKTAGLNVSRLNLFFLLLFVITVILGLKFLGVLLMGSLIIVPAAASRNLARNFNADLLISVGIALVSVIAGLTLASRYATEIGPTIITVAAAVFFISIIFKRQK